jgi:hypothetical protein
MRSALQKALKEIGSSSMQTEILWHNFRDKHLQRFSEAYVHTPLIQEQKGLGIGRMRKLGHIRQVSGKPLVVSQESKSDGTYASQTSCTLCTILLRGSSTDFIHSINIKKPPKLFTQGRMRKSSNSGTSILSHKRSAALIASDITVRRKSICIWKVRDARQQLKQRARICVCVFVRLFCGVSSCLFDSSFADKDKSSQRYQNRQTDQYQQI